MNATTSSPAALGAALADAWTSDTLLDDTAWSLPDEPAAYAAQAELARRLDWLSPGRTQFWKCGGSSREGALGHSPLPPMRAREVRGLRNGGDFSDLVLIGAEAEIALRVGQDVTPEMAAALVPGQAEHLIDAMCVAVEWLGSRWQRGLATDNLLRLADAQTHGALALGPWQAWKPGHDWANQSCELIVGDQPPMGGIGGHGLNDPAWVVAGWLQEATRTGLTVPAGSVVTTGSWRVATKLSKGATVTARYPGLGELSVRT
ncbi:fumarylacetoacetate hydrolase family protein [Mitsuaria sp. GD03876]|uniref:fumarylacetoacetate hydrolase family protein n=1 Tax=Mitsuaria sp. GD03876 TaxID=2975399 RepID=UPI0024470984|nr:fumarylacetoacetate hydrolase family protein [Mitsuaria sp. GD03876]MDH0865726.1 fumarylacetoacetate hydrolase family protein [Mitsuaria sp. GD03876]